eukprot:554032-Prymnesium_polylepis.1
MPILALFWPQSVFGRKRSSGVLGSYYGLRVPSSVWHRLRQFQCLEIIPSNGCIYRFRRVVLAGQI